MNNIQQKVTNETPNFLVTVIVKLLLPIANGILGAIAFSIAGLLFSSEITHVFSLIGLGNITPWEFGAVLGSIIALFKSVN